MDAGHWRMDGTVEAGRQALERGEFRHLGSAMEEKEEGLASPSNIITTSRILIYSSHVFCDWVKALVLPCLKIEELFQ